MKIVCDSCGAKYSIADEKVAGKIFKIRCKKCSSVLEVRGDQTGAHALDAHAGGQETASDGGWYVVVDGEQQGPLPPIELSQLFAKGSVGLDSYVWKEGFDDWRIASDVPELVAILGGVGNARKSETSRIETEGATPLGSGGDLFGDQDPEPTGDIDVRGGIFGDPSAGQAPVADAPIGAAAEEPEATDEPATSGGGLAGLATGGAAPAPARMTGQRNENSVLFSLTNLQQLASRGGSPADNGAQPVAPQSSPTPQAASEGSGLIDIRALAKSTTPGTRSAPSQAVDDLLTIGASAGGPTLGGPLLGPAPIETADNNRWLKIAGAVVVVVGVIGVGFGGGVLFRGASSDEPLEVGAMGVEPMAAEAPPGAPQTTPSAPEREAYEADAPEVEGVAFEQPVEEPVAAPDFEEPAAATRKPAPRQRAVAPRKRRKPRSSAAAAAAPQPAPQPRKRGGSLDALMDEVVGGSPAPKKTEAKPRSTGGGSSLPDSPSRSDVKTALQGVSGGVKACNQGQGGTAVVDVTFSGSTGRVSRAKVASGPLKGTSTGACVERAVKRARVPRFKQSSFKVKFPYRL